MRLNELDGHRIRRIPQGRKRNPQSLQGFQVKPVKGSVENRAKIALLPANGIGYGTVNQEDQLGCIDVFANP